MKKNDFWAETPVDYTNIKVESRKTILFPAVNICSEIKEGFKILDYGGGDGGFLESIEIDVEKQLYDPSVGLIAYAKKNRKTINHFFISDSNIQKNYFDLVTLIHVVTVIKENQELKRIFKKAFEVLKQDGSFVIGMTHPAFKNNYFSTFHTDFSTGKVNYDYLSTNLPYKVRLNTEKIDKFVSFECYHRPFSTVINFLIETGFEIKEVLEVQDHDFENPNKKFNFPPFLIIKSIKK